ncbi:MAG: hypothetical protein ACLQNE_30035 [Thermoguttaceae bacterium]
MFRVALLFLLAGQVAPPPPAPAIPPAPAAVAPPPPAAVAPPPPAAALPADQPPADVQRQREWLLAHFIVDLQAQGKFDAQKYHETEAMLKEMTASQVGVLVQFYQQRKAQVVASQEAQANAELRRLETYRDHLKRELERKLDTSQQTQAMPAPYAPMPAPYMPMPAPYTFLPTQPPLLWSVPPTYVVPSVPYYVYRPYYPYHHR